MHCGEKKSIHALFENKRYMEIYKTYPQVVNEMLMIENLADFEDFMEAEGDLDESIFGLYFSAGKGESLLIGGYEKDVTESVSHSTVSEGIFPAGMWIWGQRTLWRKKQQTATGRCRGQDTLSKRNSKKHIVQEPIFYLSCIHDAADWKGKTFLSKIKNCRSLFRRNVLYWKKCLMQRG